MGALPAAGGPSQEMLERFAYIQMRFQGEQLDIGHQVHVQEERIAGEVQRVVHVLRERQNVAQRAMADVLQEVESEHFLVADQAQAERLCQTIQGLQRTQHEIQEMCAARQEALQKKVQAQASLEASLKTLSDRCYATSETSPVQGFVEELGRRIILGPPRQSGGMNSMGGSGGGRR